MPTSAATIRRELGLPPIETKNYTGRTGPSPFRWMGNARREQAPRRPQVRISGAVYAGLSDTAEDWGSQLTLGRVF